MLQSFWWITNITLEEGPVARSLVSANRWLRGIKMYRFPWYLTLVSTTVLRATRARSSAYIKQFYLESLSYCVLINFHTTPTNWLTDWLTGGWLADWLTDYSGYQHTDQLTGLLFQTLTGWLTDCVADRLVDLLATILITNHWNKTCFSWIFGKFCTFTLHTFVLTLMCPSPSPMLSHAYFGALRRL